jgi:hypothetical protein
MFATVSEFVGMAPALVVRRIPTNLLPILKKIRTNPNPKKRLVTYL